MRRGKSKGLDDGAGEMVAFMKENGRTEKKMGMAGGYGEVMMDLIIMKDSGRTESIMDRAG